MCACAPGRRGGSGQLAGAVRLVLSVKYARAIAALWAGIPDARAERSSPLWASRWRCTESARRPRARNAACIGISLAMTRWPRPADGGTWPSGRCRPGFMRWRRHADQRCAGLCAGQTASRWPGTGRRWLGPAGRAGCRDTVAASAGAGRAVNLARVPRLGHRGVPGRARSQGPSSAACRRGDAGAGATILRAAPAASRRPADEAGSPHRPGRPATRSGVDTTGRGIEAGHRPGRRDRLSPGTARRELVRHVRELQSGIANGELARREGSLDG